MHRQLPNCVWSSNVESITQETMQENPNKHRSILTIIKEEPLFHFLGIAALLFATNALFSGDDRDVIRVDAATQQHLIDSQQSRLLRDMTDAEKSAAVDSFIEDEILVREARKRGFENSSRIRELLIQNMRFLMAGEIPEPSESDLRDFYEQNISILESPPTVTYDHVLFSDPSRVPPDIMEILNNGADPIGIGDTNKMNSRIYQAVNEAIVVAFGRDLAQDIIGIDDETWHGPFKSAQGVHFLRVYARHHRERPTWEQSKKWIMAEWQHAKNRAIFERELAQMRKNYRVEIESPDRLTE